MPPTHYLSAIIDRCRHWLPVMQGIDVIDPLEMNPIPSSHADLEVVYQYNETIAVHDQNTGTNLPSNLQALIGPAPGRCSTLLLRSRAWRLSCQHSQVISSGNYVLHDPTTSWQGIHGRSWPLLNVRRINGTVLCMTNHGTSNLYHWLFNPTLQLIRLLEEMGFHQHEAAGLYLGSAYPLPWPDYVDVTLNKLGLGAVPRLRSSIRPRILLWSVYSSSGCFPSYSQWQWLRSRLKPATSVRARKLYLGRSRANRRRVLNERALMAALHTRGFECIDDLATLSFEEQCLHLAQADVIVAPHGAALSLLFCCHPGTKLLELHCPSYLSPLYAVLAHYGSLNYQALMARSVLNVDNRTMDDMIVDIDEVLASLSAWGID